MYLVQNLIRHQYLIKPDIKRNDKIIISGFESRIAPATARTHSSLVFADCT